MKEVKIFESWADDLVESSTQVKHTSMMGTPMNSKADRPLPRNLDVQYKAQRAHPELSPEQALSLYIADELEKSEKIDKKQNIEINKVEHEEKEIESEIARLMQLVKNTR